MARMADVDVWIPFPPCFLAPAAACCFLVFGQEGRGAPKKKKIES
jgi:hypothetical protein